MTGKELRAWIADLKDQITAANEKALRLEGENKRLRNAQINKDLCITSLANSIFQLWHAVADGVYDSRSIVGDITLDMQEALMNVKIDVRNKPLDITGVRALKEKPCTG